MPPEGYTTVTISDELAEKLTQIMAQHNRSSYAEAIGYTVDTALVQEDKITVRELIQLLAERTQELD
jgi:predicted transcriptional regulator